MVKEKEYKLEDIEFKGMAYRRNKRVVRNHKTMGAIFVPTWMINKRFDVILIPNDEETKGTETKENN